MKKHIVYRTENKINGKFYYGVHNGTRPSYIGGGVALNRAVKKHGKENFVRRTVIEFDTPEEAYAFEALVVDQDFVDRNDCYNMGLGGNSGWDAARLKLGQGNGCWGRKYSEETKKKMSDSVVKPMLNLETGIFYLNSRDAYDSYYALSTSKHSRTKGKPITWRAFQAQTSGQNKNKTPFVYV